MPNDTNWALAAGNYLAANEISGELALILASLARGIAPLDLREPLGAKAAADSKIAAGHFVLFAIRQAVADHALSDSEMAALRHLTRILRLEEGDLLAHHRRSVAELLCQELERLLEDQTIDPREAVHKVKLQELLGLGYDQFIALTMPEVERVIVDLIRRLDPDTIQDSREAAVDWFHQQIFALDTVYDLNASSGSASDRSGYLYLLVNPSMPGLVKIGRTSRKPDRRVMELTSATGVPTPFLLVFELFVSDAAVAEAYVHERLGEGGSRVNANREFFNVAPSRAVEVMLEAKHVYPAA